MKNELILAVPTKDVWQILEYNENAVIRAQYTGVMDNLLLLCAYKDGEQVFVNQEFNDCYIDETSVQEQDLQQVSLYPNPAKEAVLIEGVKPAEVQLHNALGQLVKTVENTHEINVAGLPQGVYLLRIRDEEGKVFTAKLAVK